MSETEKVAAGSNIQPALQVHESLIPKEGSETSSYKLAKFSALIPIGLLALIIIGLKVTSDVEVRAVLIQMLVYVVAPSILGSAVVGVQYITKRGNLAVAKAQALGQIIAARETPTTNPELKEENK